mmetsp:Transcript_30628/g.71585  ORF Transcript_30628/g.71585 Transcript_30628/m.71585 type:complete len:440 (-) Transcript_30628:362-1681(-)
MPKQLEMSKVSNSSSLPRSCSTCQLFIAPKWLHFKCVICKCLVQRIAKTEPSAAVSEMSSCRRLLLPGREASKALRAAALRSRHCDKQRDVRAGHAESGCQLLAALSGMLRDEPLKSKCRSEVWSLLRTAMSGQLHKMRCFMGEKVTTSPLSPHSCARTSELKLTAATLRDLVPPSPEAAAGLPRQPAARLRKQGKGASRHLLPSPGISSKSKASSAGQSCSRLLTVASRSALQPLNSKTFRLKRFAFSVSAKTFAAWHVSAMQRDMQSSSRLRRLRTAASNGVMGIASMRSELKARTLLSFKGCSCVHVCWMLRTAVRQSLASRGMNAKISFHKCSVRSTSCTAVIIFGASAAAEAAEPRITLSNVPLPLCSGAAGSRGFFLICWRHGSFASFSVAPLLTSEVLAVPAAACFAALCGPGRKACRCCLSPRRQARIAAI